jgi:hypothetical protein
MGCCRQGASRMLHTKARQSALCYSFQQQDDNMMKLFRIIRSCFWKKFLFPFPCLKTDGITVCLTT